MLRYEETHPGSYYWFDPFSLNQHSETGVVETAVRPLQLGCRYIRIIARYDDFFKGRVSWWAQKSVTDLTSSHTQVLEKAFGDQIRAIGATLIVSSPW